MLINVVNVIFVNIESCFKVIIKFKYFFAFFCLSCTSLQVFSQTALFYNGNIFTSDTRNPFINYFVVENGKFTRSGNSYVSDSSENFDYKIDLKGKTVIPGIIDSHIHFIDGSLGLLQISLSNIVDSAELRNLIISTSGQMIDGYYVARDLGFPALQGISSPLNFLDKVIPDSPAIIFLKSGHAAVANSKAMKKLGITSKTKISDGSIGIAKGGELNGWLLEAAAMEALKRIGSCYSDRTIEKAVLKGQRLALSYGITTMGDNTFSPYHMKIYQAMQRDGTLKLRMWTRSFGRIPQTTSLMYPMGTKKLGLIGQGNDFTRVHYHLTKLFEDMSLSVPPGVTGIKEPGGTIYLNEKEIKHYLLLHPDKTYAFHVQGEKGLQNIIDALNEPGNSTNHHRHVIDHAGYCTEDQLTELKKLGASVTILASQTFDYPAIIRQYGATGVPLRENELLNARLKYRILDGALSSDFPYGMDTNFVHHKNIDGLNPFPNMAVNVCGKFPDGSVIKGFENKTLTVSEAIHSYTVNGAYVLGAENLLGKIAPGYAADFLILEDSLSETDPMDLYSCKVAQTYIAGEKVFDINNAERQISSTVEKKIKPYDYTISPVFGYDPTTGFIFGAAGFVFPLKTPASYGDLQLMATTSGKVQVQAKYIRYGLLKDVDFKMPVTYTNFIEYYFGEGDTTSSESFNEIFSDRYFVRPEFELKVNDHFKASLFGDFRVRNENAVKDKEGNTLNMWFFPDEKNIGSGLGLFYDTRDNPVSTKLGFYSAIYYENISELSFSDFWKSGLLFTDLRYFHYITNSKFVLASRISGGISYGNPSYLFRYTLGGAERLRGYYTNRYRGDRFYSAQLEFRFPLYKKFSGVCFLDEGDVSDAKLNKTLFSYGGGIRFSINDNVNLRLDYGIGKDQNGVLFTFGEAF